MPKDFSVKLHVLSCISCVSLLNQKAGQATGAPRVKSHFLHALHGEVYLSFSCSFVLFVVKVYLNVSLGCSYAELRFQRQRNTSVLYLCGS